MSPAELGLKPRGSNEPGKSAEVPSTPIEDCGSLGGLMGLCAVLQLSFKRFHGTDEAPIKGPL